MGATLRTGPLGLEDAIDAMTEAARAYADARATEMQGEHERPAAKQAAILRIMAERGLAATPAEKLAETDPDYAEYLAAQRGAVVTTILRRAEYEAAKARLWATVRPAEDGL